MFDRSLLKERAKDSIKANYWMSVLVAFLLSFITVSITRNVSDQDVSSIGSFLRTLQNSFGTNFIALFGALFGALSLIGVAISLLIKIFVENPYEVGLKYFFVKNARSKATLADAFTTFQDNYVNVCKVIFVKNLIIAFWSIFLVIPGIYKALEYSQVDFIVSDDHSIDWRDALRKSSEMTRGIKLDILLLKLSFIGWDILCFIPFLQILWVAPYKRQTEAELYYFLKYNY